MQPALAQLVGRDQDDVQGPAVLKPDHLAWVQRDRSERAVELDAVGEVAAGLSILVEGVAGVLRLLGEGLCFVWGRTRTWSRLGLSVDWAANLPGVRAEAIRNRPQPEAGGPEWSAAPFAL